jgi:NADH:ubiquinone oxidoreductase subunit
VSLINNFKIRFCCNKVGSDEFSNEYYEEKKPSYSGKKRRYVIYHGIAEASKVPAEWHLWLHYTSNNIPVNVNTHKYAWQKIHLPNLTGTKNAYFPFGSKFRDGKRHKVSADYQPWNPNQNIQ